MPKVKDKKSLLAASIAWKMRHSMVSKRIDL